MTLLARGKTVHTGNWQKEGQWGKGVEQHATGDAGTRCSQNREKVTSSAVRPKRSLGKASSERVPCRHDGVGFVFGTGRPGGELLVGENGREGGSVSYETVLHGGRQAVTEKELGDEGGEKEKK